MEDNNRDRAIDEVVKLLGEHFEKNQNRPDQYVVAYKRTEDDTVFGYHGDTFCTPFKDILHAKRYSGDNPFSQLTIIAKNLEYTLEGKAPIGAVKERYYKNIEAGDLYLDAIYLAEGTPKQNFKYKII